MGSQTMNQVRNLLETRFPGLLARIEKTIVESEAQFNQQNQQAPSEFLLDHTQRTAAIAHKIASLEGVDPFLPVVVALFHDAGKFHEGGYHKDNIPEEEHAAALAETMLAEFGLGRADIDTVLQSLRALYDDRLPCIGPGRIVQDADRLDKLGTLGVGTFFTKATLRGRGLVESLVQALSRELTYALAAQHSMFTATGRRLAAGQAAKTVAFFDELLADLESWGIAAFERRNIRIEEDFRTRDGKPLNTVDVTIVMPRSCPECDHPLELHHERGRGVKCEKLTARFDCDHCGYKREISFCLPVFA